MFFVCLTPLRFLINDFIYLLEINIDKLSYCGDIYNFSNSSNVGNTYINNQHNNPNKNYY